MADNIFSYNYNVEAAKKIRLITGDYEHILCVGCTCDFFIKNFNAKYKNISCRASLTNNDLSCLLSV